MPLIKAIIADVDGVMVGKQPGTNFPLPNTQEIDALRKVSASGVPIILCTTKFNFAIKEIAQLAQLANPHITDGGAVIKRFQDNTVVKKYPIEKKIVEQYVQACTKQSIYTELYTADAYYVESSQINDFTKKRSHLLQCEPITSTSLYETSQTIETVKILTFIETSEQQRVLEDIVNTYGTNIHFIWSHHPYLLPLRIGVMTASHVSKASAAKELIKDLRLQFSNVLGIGNATSDWNFMRLCKYVATVGSESEELLQNASTRPPGDYYLAPDVDSHGLIDILKHYKLI